jgi:hypothetical protein
MGVPMAIPFLPETVDYCTESNFVLGFPQEDAIVVPLLH